MEDQIEELGTPEPVGGAERLLGEVAPAVDAAEPLDAVRQGAPAEEAGTSPSPASLRLAVRWAAFVGTVRGPVEGRRLGHAEGALQPSRHMQSSGHDASDAVFRWRTRTARAR